MQQLARQPNIKSQTFRLAYKIPKGMTAAQAVVDAQSKGYILITNSRGEPPILICDDDIEYVPSMEMVQAWLTRAFRSKKDSLI
jgi:hypothetical protein